MTEETKQWVVIENDWEHDDLKDGELSNLSTYNSLEGAEEAATRSSQDQVEVYQITTKLVSVVRTIKTTEVERL
jgi:hypothetical protein